MRLTRSWQLGDPNSLVETLYDGLRKRLNQKLVRYLSVQLEGLPDAYVVEAGSGPGYASSLFSQVPGVRLSAALDIDSHALNAARRRDPGLTLVVGDLQHMPFASCSFDLVWNSSTLEHVDDPISCIKEMARVQKAKGKVFAGFPYAYGLLGFQKWINTTSLGIWIGKLFDDEQVEELILQSGLSLLELNTYFYHFFIGAIATKQATEKSSS